MDLKSILIHLSAFIIGVLPGFFIVFNSIYSDANGSIWERLFTFILVFITYSILGFVFGRLSRKNPISLGIALSLPSSLLLILYLFKEPQLVGIILLYLALSTGASCLGSILGSRNKGLM
jgi:DMSO reductase anchor subunit